jgi:hypothetical protein
MREEPSWFKKKDCGYLTRLDAAGWPNELGRYHRLLEDAGRRQGGELAFVRGMG